ncbi:MAG: hypothetical protein ACRDXD_04230 [Acidimicrobiia bacterium]
MKKSGKEIMEILEACDLTHCYWSAAALAGCDPKTVERYVALRDRRGDPYAPGRRERITDPHIEKIEEWVERSRGRIRGDVVHRRLQAMGLWGLRAHPPAGGGRGQGRLQGRPGAAPTDPGSPSRRCGCIGTGERGLCWGRGETHGAPSSSAPGWPGAATGWYPHLGPDPPPAPPGSSMGWRTIIIAQAFQRYPQVGHSGSPVRLVGFCGALRKSGRGA